MKRLLLPLVLVVALIAAVTASAGSKEQRSEGKERTAKVGGKHRGGGHAAFLLRGLAQRLGVSVDELRVAFRDTGIKQLDRAVAAGKVTEQQRTVLVPCIRREATCDRKAARRAGRKLHRSLKLKTLDLVVLKDQLAEDFAASVGKPQDEVLTAVRAELEGKLSLGVVMGKVTQQKKALVLGCFDAPASCDRKALRRALKHQRHGRRGHR